MSLHYPGYAIDFNYKKEARMGIKASDLKVGDKIKRVSDGRGSRACEMTLGREYRVTAIHGSGITIEGGINLMDGLVFCEKVVEPVAFQPGDIVRRTGHSFRSRVNSGGEYEVERHSNPGGSFGGVVVLKAVPGTFDGNKFELVTRAADKPKPLHTVTKRVMTDMTIQCASGDGDKVVFGYDPTGSLDDGPCLDIEIVHDGDAFGPIADIEDIDTLRALHTFLGHRIEDFKKDAKA